MKDALRKIYYAIIKILPDRMVINFENIRAYGRKLNDDKEKVLYCGEKIQYLKLYGNMERYNDLVDKYMVRNYIQEKIGEEYLIPLLGVYDSPDSKIKKEYQYKNVIRKIICEKFMSDKNGELLDYKFFCFDGNPLFVKVDFDRYTEHKINFYDMNWNRIYMNEGNYKSYEGISEKPVNFDSMINIAKKLSRDFQFVRVDLYNIDGKIYFGELTFTPTSGKNPFYPLEKDLEISERIKI